MLRKLTNIILIILLALFQISFLNVLPLPFNAIKIILILMIFATFIDYRYGLYWLFAGVLVLELYSQYPFGVVLLSYFATFCLIVILFKNVFTNKSWYVLIVAGLIGLASCDACIYLLNYLLQIFNLSPVLIKINQNYFIFFMFQIVTNLIFLAFLFLSYKMISKRMKAVFLVR